MSNPSLFECEIQPHLHKNQTFSQRAMHSHPTALHVPTPCRMNNPAPYTVPPYMMRPDQTRSIRPEAASTSMFGELVDVRKAMEASPTPTPCLGYDQIAGYRRVYSVDSIGTKRIYNESSGSDDRSISNGKWLVQDASPAY